MNFYWFCVKGLLRNALREGGQLALSICGMGAGIFVLLLTFSIMDGYKVQLEKSLYRFFPYAYCTLPSGVPLPEEAKSWVKREVWSEGLVVPCGKKKGAFIHIRGKEGISSIRMGKALASALHINLGSCVHFFYPGPGRAPLRYTGSVQELFSSGIHSVDKGWVELPLEKIPDIRGEVRWVLSNEEALRHVKELLPSGTNIITLRESQQQLFGMLSFQEKIMAFVLSLITWVAGVFLLSRLMLDLHERGRTFGLLQALGLERKRLFFLLFFYSFFLGCIGVLGGMVLGRLGIAVVNHTNLLALPLPLQTIYGINRLALQITPFHVLVVFLFGISVVFLASCSVALWVIRRNPLSNLRFE